MKLIERALPSSIFPAEATFSRDMTDLLLLEPLRDHNLIIGDMTDPQKPNIHREAVFAEGYLADIESGKVLAPVYLEYQEGEQPVIQLTPAYFSDYTMDEKHAALDYLLFRAMILYGKGKPRVDFHMSVDFEKGFELPVNPLEIYKEFSAVEVFFRSRWNLYQKYQEIAHK